ncbi:hypothetical protein [Pulveribacter suum]|uniref:hypothetical protein n=1 Tax=Pulveribacter suum TaxID=2116657 RepID=UPI0013003DFC|nr:hypothetical protein [Pulveribacter suum]
MALASSNAHAYRLYIVKAPGKISRSTEAPHPLFPNLAAISEALNYNRFQSNLSNLRAFRPPLPTSCSTFQHRRSVRSEALNYTSEIWAVARPGEDFLRTFSGCF